MGRNPVRLVDARVVEEILRRAQHTLQFVPRWLPWVRHGLERIVYHAGEALTEPDAAKAA